MKILLTFLDILSAISAVIAAIFWYRSTKVKTGGTFIVYVSPAQALGGPVGVGHSPQLEELAAALTKQSKLSAIAAFFAAIAALAQSIAVIIRILTAQS